MAAFVRRLEGGDDPRRAIAAARLRALQVRWRAQSNRTGRREAFAR